jgi:hypothetical protein
MSHNYSICSSRVVTFSGTSTFVGIFCKNRDETFNLLLLDLKNFRIVGKLNVSDQIRTHSSSHLLFHKNQPLLVVISATVLFVVSKTGTKQILLTQKTPHDLVYFDESIGFVFLKNLYNKIIQSINVIKLLDID